MHQNQRKAGILLHPTSLPADDGIGDLGPTAYRFLDFLHQAGVGVWQVLPLVPTAYGNSPYTGLSSFAGNPLLISLELLRRELPSLEGEIGERPDFPLDRVVYPEVQRWKMPLLRRAAEIFLEEADGQQRSEYDEFCNKEKRWLEDYAFFVTAKAFYDQQASREGARSSLWYSYWPRALATKDPSELARRREDWSAEIETEKVMQFFFQRQWSRLRTYAAERGVEIFGDMPIFVAGDSADVWSWPELFQLDKNLKPQKVAGVPPDYFSAEGQRWGNPLYRWPEHRKQDFSWWKARVKKALEYCDIVRIDHFRGFEACWEIPAREKTAINGKWVKSPGRELFRALQDELGELPVVAEDLGVITPEVLALRRDFALPGMKVLQFAFEPARETALGRLNSANPFLPHNYESACVAYTGTHDNDTSRSWYDSLDQGLRGLVDAYLGRTDSSEESAVWSLIRVLFMSVAAYAIVPLQDVLDLGAEARMNTPATVGGNWSWRVRREAFNSQVAERLRELSSLYGRLAAPIDPGAPQAEK